MIGAITLTASDRAKRIEEAADELEVRLQSAASVLDILSNPNNEQATGISSAILWAHCVKESRRASTALTAYRKAKAGEA